MAKFLFASVVPICTLSTRHEGKRQTPLRQTFATMPWQEKKKGLIYAKR